MISHPLKRKPAATVHAFEPAVESFKLLALAAAMNHLTNIRPVHAAIGAVDGPAYLHRLGGNDGRNFVATTPQWQDAEPVTMRTLDRFCAEHSIARIDLLKLDIEGGEYDALRGAAGLLSRRAVGHLFIELIDRAGVPSGATTAEIKDLLQGWGYHLRRMTPRGLVPLASDGARGDNFVASAVP